MTDVDLTAKDVAGLTSADAIAAFLAKLRYDTGGRELWTTEAVDLSGDSAAAVKRIELLAGDEFLRIVFVQSKSLTAKVRNDLARVLGRRAADYLLILASDFDTLEFVLIDKRKRESAGPVPV